MQHLGAKGRCNSAAKNHLSARPCSRRSEIIGHKKKSSRHLKLHNNYEFSLEVLFSIICYTFLIANLCIKICNIDNKIYLFFNVFTSAFFALFIIYKSIKERKPLFWLSELLLLVIIICVIKNILFLDEFSLHGLQII